MSKKSDASVVNLGVITAIGDMRRENGYFYVAYEIGAQKEVRVLSPELARALQSKLARALGPAAEFVVLAEKVG